MEVVFHLDDEEKLLPATWAVMVKELAGRACQACGSRTKKLYAHHKNGNADDNRLANGRCLCAACNVKANRALRRKARKALLEDQAAERQAGVRTRKYYELSDEEKSRYPESVRRLFE